MDQILEVRHATTSRGFRYRYYLSPPPSPAPSATDPVLLLLHGWPDGAALWQFIVPHLLRRTPRLRVLAPDLLGYGGTDKPTDPALFTSDLASRDVLDLVAHAGFEPDRPLIPVGHDWGAFFAQRFYLAHAARCAGLVTLSVAFAPPTGEKFDLETFNALTQQAFGYPAYTYWELFTAPDGPKLLTERLESLWYVLHGEAEDWVQRMFCTRGAMREWLEADRRDVPLKEYGRDEKLRAEWIATTREGGLTAPCCSYRVVKENFQTEVEKTLPKKVEKPYLFIGSTGDAVCRTDAVQIPIQEGLLSDVTVKELTAGHWIPYEKPDETAEILVAWLKEKDFA